MKRAVRGKEQGLAHLGIVVSIIVTVIFFVGLYVFRNSSNSAHNAAADVPTPSSPTSPAESIITEEWKPLEETATDSQTPDAEGQEDDFVPEPQKKLAPSPTMFPDGPSTKLDRSDVHGVNLTTSQIYGKYLFALHSADKEKRREVSQAFFEENKAYFSTSFYDENASSADSLPLLGLSIDAKLPASLRNGSSIVHPEDPTRIMVQILLEGYTWSLILEVKLKNHWGAFGTLEKIYVRPNTDPL